MDQKKKITIDFDNQPQCEKPEKYHSRLHRIKPKCKRPAEGEIYRHDRKEPEKEGSTKKIVITKDTKLGDAWLHNSQDLMGEEEKEKLEKRIEELKQEIKEEGKRRAKLKRRNIKPLRSPKMMELLRLRLRLEEKR